MLRRLSGCNREEMTVGWRKLHYEEIQSFFLSDVIRLIMKVNEVCKACNKCRREINACGFLVRIPEGKRPLGRHVHRWEDNIKMDLQEVE